MRKCLLSTAISLSKENHIAISNFVGDSLLLHVLTLTLTVWMRKCIGSLNSITMYPVCQEEYHKTWTF